MSNQQGEVIETFRKKMEVETATPLRVVQCIANYMREKGIETQGLRIRRVMSDA